jgi:DNA-binding protein H-NS
MPKRTYAQIQNQIEELQRQAEAMRKKEVEGVIARIKEAISVYGLSAADLGLSGKGGAAAKPAGRAVKKRKAGTPARKRVGRAVKYSDGNGNTWVGRGPRPQWVKDALAAGKQLSDFAV